MQLFNSGDEEIMHLIPVVNVYFKNPLLERTSHCKVNVHLKTKGLFSCTTAPHPLLSPKFFSLARRFLQLTIIKLSLEKVCRTKSLRKALIFLIIRANHHSLFS